MNEETWNELDLLATWQDSRWQIIFAQSLLIQILLHFCKKTADKWIDQTFFKAQRKVLHRIYFVIKILQKMQQILIVNVISWANIIITTIIFVSIYCSCFFRLQVVSLCIFCVVMQITLYKVPCKMHISTLNKVKLREKCAHYIVNLYVPVFKSLWAAQMRPQRSKKFCLQIEFIYIYIYSET